MYSAGFLMPCYLPGLENGPGKRCLKGSTFILKSPDLETSDAFYV
jgi:hypothetical protein